MAEQIDHLKVAEELEYHGSTGVISGVSGAASLGAQSIRHLHAENAQLKRHWIEDDRDLNELTDKVAKQEQEIADLRRFIALRQKLTVDAIGERLAMNADVKEALECWRNSGGFHSNDPSECFDKMYLLAAAFVAQNENPLFGDECADPPPLERE